VVALAEQRNDALFFGLVLDAGLDPPGFDDVQRVARISLLEDHRILAVPSLTEHVINLVQLLLSKGLEEPDAPQQVHTLVEVGHSGSPWTRGSGISAIPVEVLAEKSKVDRSEIRPVIE